MPFVPTVMANLMRAKAVPSKILGSKSTPLLSAVSSAVCSYVPAAAVVVSTNMVTGPGSGTMTGKIVGCVPSAMSSMMVMKATSLGLRGRDMARLFDAISFGVCQVLQTLSVAQGTVIGGGPGAGTGKITNLVPSVLERLIVASLAGRVLMGSKTSPVFTAVAFGICTHIMTAGTVVTTCVGAFAPPPAGPVPIPCAPGPGRLY